MNYYLDRNIEYERETDENIKYFTSNYTNQNTKNLTVLTLDSDEQKKIINNSFEKIGSFYNENLPYFKIFENRVGVNIWFLTHFRTYFQYKNFLLNLACIKNQLKSSPETIVITADRKLFNYIDKDSIKLVAAKVNVTDKKFLVKESWQILTQFKPNLRFNTEHILIGQPGQINFRFGELASKFDLIYNRNQFDSKKKLVDKKEYKKRINVDNIVGNYFFSFKWIKEMKEFVKANKQIQKDLIEYSTSEDSRLICSFLFNQKSSIYFFLIRYFSFKHFFKKQSLKSILLIDENSPQQKVIQYAAKQAKLRVFAVQHGMIYTLHPAYMYGHYKESPLLPDTTFTWGEYYTNLLLTSGGYSSNQVLTTGRIPENNGQRISSQLLNTDQELIVYATQPQPDINLRKKELLTVLSVIQKMGDRYRLVLRPHPSEKDDAYFYKIGDTISFSNFYIDRTSDLVTHFEKCSLLITSYSTVGAEFVAFNKPLVILDLLKQDKVNYIKEGVGIPIYSEEDLLNVLQQKNIKINKEAYLSFINNYFFCNGNKAIELILDKIEGND